MRYELFPLLLVGPKLFPAPNVICDSFVLLLSSCSFLDRDSLFLHLHRLVLSQDSEGLAADLQSALCVCVPPLLYSAQQVLATLVSHNTGPGLLNSVRPLASVWLPPPFLLCCLETIPPSRKLEHSLDFPFLPFSQRSQWCAMDFPHLAPVSPSWPEMDVHLGSFKEHCSREYRFTYHPG